jgi:hypothetical protein
MPNTFAPAIGRNFPSWHCSAPYKKTHVDLPLILAQRGCQIIGILRTIISQLTTGNYYIAEFKQFLCDKNFGLRKRSTAGRLMLLPANQEVGREATSRERRNFLARHFNQLPVSADFHATCCARNRDKFLLKEWFAYNNTWSHNLSAEKIRARHIYSGSVTVIVVHTYTLYRVR